jgi:hypothetical protein
MPFHRHLAVPTETQEHSTIIKTYPSTTKPINQETKVDVCDFSMEKHLCMHLAKGQCAYIHDCQEKTHVYVSKHS